ncbi:MAG: hypothetical protein KKF41_02605 [Actinobacteria bacterium]|nr:hypothetical protein [Actinomycetota bacterium]MBU1943525.1 hypothetical protein [Actinomycetota bacterium]MBU2686458.1 hypothetical protein [Actinomycetota bacterium]
MAELGEKDRLLKSISKVIGSNLRPGETLVNIDVGQRKTAGEAVQGAAETYRKTAKKQFVAGLLGGHMARRAVTNASRDEYSEAAGFSGMFAVLLTDTSLYLVPITPSGMKYAQRDDEPARILAMEGLRVDAGEISETTSAPGATARTLNATFTPAGGEPVTLNLYDVDLWRSLAGR